ncbi:MAG: type I restriction endonuclease [Armatimonadota bacterium]
MPGRPSELQYVEGPLLAQLEFLGWTVLALDESDKHDPQKSFRSTLAEVILVKKLKAALFRLNPWLNDAQINELCNQLQAYPYPRTRLLENNIAIYDRIAEGLSANNKQTGEVNCPVRLIDWSDADNYIAGNSLNEFLAISQYKVRIPGKEEHIIPDVVLFVNGLPLVVIECKAPDIDEPIAEGIDQLMRYQDRRNAQTSEGVPELFFFNQFVVSTCYHSACYTSITGGPSHFIEWKDPYPLKLVDIKPAGVPSSQEILVVGMLEPSRLLDIVQNYTVYIDDDEGHTIKIAPRYMQYRGARKIIERLRQAQAGGTLWHTQGSGKSLTMMFVIRKMYNSSDLNNYKIVLLIDRKDLQTQLFTTTKAVKYTVNEAHSIANLRQLIQNTASDVTVAMVHKFGEQASNPGLFPVLNLSNRILVMIDEAHRSEYSELAANMCVLHPSDWTHRIRTLSLV